MIGRRAVSLAVIRVGCIANSQGTWCRVGYPGQSGRVLWGHGGSLIVPGDGE